MSLNEPKVSRAIATIMKSLDREQRFELSELTFEFTDLEQLPQNYQDLITEEMAKAITI